MNTQISQPMCIDRSKISSIAENETILGFTKVLRARDFGRKSPITKKERTKSTLMDIPY